MQNTEVQALQSQALPQQWNHHKVAIAAHLGLPQWHRSFASMHRGDSANAVAVKGVSTDCKVFPEMSLCFYYDYTLFSTHHQCTVSALKLQTIANSNYVGIQ